MDDSTWQFVVLLAALPIGVIAGLIALELVAVVFNFARGLIFGR
jgi:hypothetical protein